MNSLDRVLVLRFLDSALVLCRLKSAHEGNQGSPLRESRNILCSSIVSIRSNACTCSGGISPYRSSGNSPVYKYHRYLPVNCQLGPFGIAILYKQLIMARLSGVSTRSNRYTFTDSRVDRDSAGSGTGSVCSHHNAHLANQRAFLESG